MLLGQFSARKRKLRPHRRTRCLGPPVLRAGGRCGETQQALAQPRSARPHGPI